jgi:hypothetical protein
MKSKFKTKGLKTERKNCKCKMIWSGKLTSKRRRKANSAKVVFPQQCLSRTSSQFLVQKCPTCLI